MPLREDLHAWLAGLPLWQQDLARRLILQTELLDGDYDASLEAVRSAHGAGSGADAPELVTLALDELPGAVTDEAPRLLSFGRLVGVGAASPDHALSINAHGLTISYGQNGTGKTTYVRALKQVCRTVDRDVAVRGNVFREPEDGGSGPSAKVEVLRADGMTEARELNLAGGDDELGLAAISVFDSDCAEHYVDDDNGLAFVPPALRVLARMAATQDQMRRDLTAEIAALQDSRPTFADIPASTGAGAKVASLTAFTSIPGLRELAVLDKTEQARLAELRAAFATAEASSARADAEAAKEDARVAAELSTTLTALAGRVSEDATTALRDAAGAATTADAAVEVSTRAFSDMAVEGVGDGPWRVMWDAARAFATQPGTAFPPVAGGHCPLCLQEIDDTAAERMAHFETHIVSAVQSTARDAQATLDAELAKVAETHVTAARSDFLAGLADREPDLYKSVEGQLDDLDARMAALREDPAGAAATPVDAAPATALTTWAEQRQKHAETLLATEDPEKKDALGSEKAELEARLTLAARLPDAESWVITLARVRKLEAAKTALATNRITSKQREMAEGLVTEDFKAQLTAEMERLSCALPVDLDPSTSVGETQVTLRLAGAHGTPKVSDIASEGEHRAVSLAFFLAEVGLAGGDGGIVVDDPVSSLDDLRREYIAERLVAESQHRQVIVFTHDLPFVHDLLGEAKKVGIEPAVRGIWSMGDVVGLVDEAPPFKAMRFRARVGKLTETVEHWDDQDPPRDQDEAWSRVRGLYADMRSTWERGVEERLFRGVVARFQRSVKTQSLSEVNFTAEHIEMVEAGMTRCSLFAHDEPMPAAVSLPGRAQLATDVEALRDFEKATRAS